MTKRQKFTKSQREDLKRQVYSAELHGMTPAEISRAFGLSEATVDFYLIEMRNRSVDRLKEIKEDENQSMAYLLDHIQTLRSGMFSTVQDIKRDGGKASLGSLYGGLIHLVELEAKIRGLMATKLVGPDGQGPIQIMAVDDRKAAIEEIVSRLEQETTRIEPPLLEEEAANEEQ